MGAERVQRKIRKTTDKKFVFDWNNEEDTSFDKVKSAPRSIIGRGHLGGMDLSEEQKAKNALYESVLKSRKENGGDEMYVRWLTKLGMWRNQSFQSFETNEAC